MKQILFFLLSICAAHACLAENLVYKVVLTERITGARAEGVVRFGGFIVFSKDYKSATALLTYKIKSVNYYINEPIEDIAVSSLVGRNESDYIVVSLAKTVFHSGTREVLTSDAMFLRGIKKIITLRPYLYVRSAAPTLFGRGGHISSDAVTGYITFVEDTFSLVIDKQLTELDRSISYEAKVKSIVDKLVSQGYLNNKSS